MPGLVIDLQVAMSGAGTGDFAHQNESRELMKVMLAEGGRLVLDDGHMILYKYEQCMRSPYGEWWLREIFSRDRVDFVSRSTIDKGSRVALKEQGFHGEDLERFVRTASASESGLLVAHEPHYHAPKVKKLLRKRLRVHVITAIEAIELVL